MDVKRFRELVGEGAFWILIISGFFIMIESHLNPNPCCPSCTLYAPITNSVPEIVENISLTNETSSVE